VIVAGLAAAVAFSAVPSSQASIYGNYVAKLSEAGLEAAGIDTVYVGGPGVWPLSITPKSVTFTPPQKEPTKYRIVGLTATRITLGPNPECSTKFGRTHNSIFRLAHTAAGLRFTKVTTACKEDVGALAVAAWRKKESRKETAAVYGSVSNQSTSAATINAPTGDLP
jgi:hypothetical protein